MNGSGLRRPDFAKPFLAVAAESRAKSWMFE